MFNNATRYDRISQNSFAAKTRKTAVVQKWSAFFGLLFLSANLSAQGFILPRDPAEIQLQYYHADVDVKENIANFKTVHKFYNAGSGTAQGVFYFPLPQGAQVTDFTLYADGKAMRGELLDADEARKIYTDIVRKALDPALLEMMDKNTFKASVFPIPAGQTRQIDVEFSTILEQQGGLVKFSLPFRGRLQTEGRVLPMIRPWDRMPIELNTVKPSLDKKSKQRPLLRSVEIKLASATPINNVYSPSHEIDVTRRNDRKLNISYEGREGLQAGDFVVYYALDLSDVSMRMLTQRDRRSKPGYFSLMISPRAELSKNAVSAKDVVLVVDVSGSMSGKKIEQAKESLRYWIENLNRKDRFGLITFSSTVKKFEDNLASPGKGREDALNFIEKMEARGGTNIHEALTAAFELAEESENALIVFVTDGLPTSGETNERKILQNVTEKNRGNVRVFTYGLGYDVNTRLLDGVARETNAFSDYVSPDENLEERISMFYDKIRYPVLTNVEIDFGDAETEDLYPHKLPDLFKGQQLIIFGRYKSVGNFNVSLSGEINGRRQSFAQKLHFAGREYDNEFIAPLWASRKIGYLLDEIQMNGESDELREEIVALSKEFGIVTPYTSYLAKEESRAPESLTLGRHRLQSLGKNLNESMITTTDQFMAPKSPQASGASAVQASQAKNRSKQASGYYSSQEDASQARTLRAGGRQFFLSENGYWNDIAADLDKPDLHIKFGGEAYFALLATYPKIGSLLSVGEKINLVWLEKTVRIDENGAEKIDAQELKRLFE